jgi:transketolase
MKRKNLQKIEQPLSYFDVPIEYQCNIAAYLKHSAWKMVAIAESGHLGAPSSSAELLTALYFGGYINLDLEYGESVFRDKVMIRGHLGPLRYSLFNLLGWVNDDEISSYRRLGSRLQGHEKMGLIKGIDITPSGALGMLLSYGVGSAITDMIKKTGGKSIVFLGDGEEQEGNVSEAARHAASMKLNNLFCVIDKNGKQLSRPTEDVDVSNLAKVWSGYGWEVTEINNGHDLNEINSVYKEVFSKEHDKPVLIIANTIKGNGLPGALESDHGFHTAHAFGIKSLNNLCDSLNVFPVTEIKNIIFNFQHYKYIENKKMSDITPCEFVLEPNYSISIEESLESLFKQSGDFMKRGLPLFLLTADLITKKETKKYGLFDQDHYIDVGIREQHLFALSHALSVSDNNARVIVKSHDAFLYRAADQIQSINLGGSKVIVFGDYGGLSGCYNGETHISVGQSSVILGMANTELFEPADSQDFWEIINYALNDNPGLVYIRLYSKETPYLARITSNKDCYVTYEPKETPVATIVSCGLTAKDCVEAATNLEERGIFVRVVNMVKLKGFSEKNVLSFLQPGKPVLTVYNGTPSILESIVSKVILSKLNKETVKSYIHGIGFSVGESGTMGELKKTFGLDAPSIEESVIEMLRD